MGTGGVLSAVAAEDDFEGALNAFRRALEEENEDEFLEDVGEEEIGRVGEKFLDDGLPGRTELVADSQLSYEIPLGELDEEDALPEGWEEEMSSLGTEGLGSAEACEHEGEHEARLVYRDSQDADSARCCTSTSPAFSNPCLSTKVGGEEGYGEREFIEPALRSQQETGGANDAVLPVESMSTSAEEAVAEGMCQVGVEGCSLVSLSEVEEVCREAEGAVETGEVRTALSGNASSELGISPTPPEGRLSAMENVEYVQDTAPDVDLEPKPDDLDSTLQPVWDSQQTGEAAVPKIQEVEHARELEVQRQGGSASCAGEILEPAMVERTEGDHEGELIDPASMVDLGETTGATALPVESTGTFTEEKLAVGAYQVGAERRTFATVPEVDEVCKKAEDAGRPSEVHIESLSEAPSELPITPELSECGQVPSGAEHTQESAADVNAETKQLHLGTVKIQELVVAPEFARSGGISLHNGTQDAKHLPMELSSRQASSRAADSLDVLVTEELEDIQDSAPKDQSLPMDIDTPPVDHEGMLTMKSAVSEQDAVVQTSVEYVDSNMITGMNLDVETRDNNNFSSWEWFSSSAAGMTHLLPVSPPVENCNAEQMLEKPESTLQVVEEVILQSTEHTMLLSTKSSSAIVHEDEDMQEVDLDTHGEDARHLPDDGDALDPDGVKDMLHPVGSTSPDKLFQCKSEMAAKEAMANGADDRRTHACSESSLDNSNAGTQEDSTVDECPSELEARIHVDEGMALHSAVHTTHAFIQSSLNGDDSIQGSRLDGDVTNAGAISSSMPGMLQAVECALPRTAVTLEGDSMPSKREMELVDLASGDNGDDGSMPAPVSVAQQQQAQIIRGVCAPELDLAPSICSNNISKSSGRREAGVASSSLTGMRYFLSNGRRHDEFQPQQPVAPASSSAEKDGSLSTVTGMSGKGVLPSTECQATVSVGQEVDVLPATCGTLQDVEVLEPSVHVVEVQLENPMLVDITAVSQMCYGRLNEESSTSQLDGVQDDGKGAMYNTASVGDELAATPCEETGGSTDSMEQGSKAFLKSVTSAPLSKEGTVDDDSLQQGIEATAVCSSRLVEMSAAPDEVISEPEGRSLHENQEAGAITEMLDGRDALLGVPADTQCAGQNELSVLGGNNAVGSVADCHCSSNVAESSHLVATTRQNAEDMDVHKADWDLEEEACPKPLPATDETTFSSVDDEMQLEIGSHGNAAVVAGCGEDKPEVYVQKSTALLLGTESYSRRTCTSEQQATGLDEINGRAGSDTALGDKQHDRTGMCEMSLGFTNVDMGNAQDAHIDCSQEGHKQPGTDKGLVVEDVPSLDDAGRVHGHLKQQTNSKGAHVVSAVSEAYQLAEIEKSREILRAEARKALAFESANVYEVEKVTVLHKAFVDFGTITARSLMGRETGHNVQVRGDRSSDTEDGSDKDDPVSSLTESLADVTKLAKEVADAEEPCGVGDMDHTTMSLWNEGQEHISKTDPSDEDQDLFNVGSINNERGSARKSDGVTGIACKPSRCLEGAPVTEALYQSVKDDERLDGEEGADTKLTLTVGLQGARSNLQPFVHLQSLQGCSHSRKATSLLLSGNQLEGEDTSDTKLCLNSGLVGNTIKEQYVILDLPSMKTGAASEEISPAIEVTDEKLSLEQAVGPVELAFAVGLDGNCELNQAVRADDVYEGISMTEDINSDPGSLRSTAKESRGAGPTLGNTLVYSELRALMDFVKAQSSPPEEVASVADDLISSGPRAVDALSHQDTCPSDLVSDMKTVSTDNIPCGTDQLEAGAKAVGENEHPLESTLIVDLQHSPTGGGVTTEAAKDGPLSGRQGDHGTATDGGEQLDISPSIHAPSSGMRGPTATRSGTARSQERAESPAVPPADDSVTPSTRGVKRGAIFQTYKPRKRASKEPQQIRATNTADSLQTSCPTRRGGANDEQGVGKTMSLTGPHEHPVAVGDLSSTMSWIPVEIPIVQEKPKQRLKTLARKRVSDAESLPDADSQPAKRSFSTSRTVPHHQPFGQSSLPPVVTPPFDVWPMRRMDHQPGVAGPALPTAATRTPLGAPLHTESDFANGETRRFAAGDGAANPHVSGAGLHPLPDPPASSPFGPMVQTVHPADSERGILPAVQDQPAPMQAPKATKRKPKRKGQTVAGASPAVESPVAGGTELPQTNGRQKRQTHATGTGELNVSQLKQDVHRVRNIISRRLEALGSHCYLLLQDMGTEADVDLAATESRRHLIFSEDQREEFVQRVVKSCRTNSRTRTWFLGTVRKIASLGVMKDAASKILSEGHCETAEDVVTAWERMKSDPSDSHESFLNLCHTVDELHKQGSGLFDGLVASEDTESSLLKRTEDGKWDLQIPPQVTKTPRKRRGSSEAKPGK